MKITLPIYYRFEFKTKKDKISLVGLNNYRNWHHNVSNKIKHHYHDLVKELIGDRKFGKIRLKYDVYLARNGTDGHNVRSIIEKFFLDGLVECGAIPDDSTPKYIPGDDGTDYYMDSENPRMEIEIREQ